MRPMRSRLADVMTCHSPSHRSDTQQGYTARSTPVVPRGQQACAVLIQMQSCSRPKNAQRAQREKAHLSCPAASRLTSGCAVRIQKRSCSRRKVCTPMRLDMSHTRSDLSSESEMIRSCVKYSRVRISIL